MDRFWKPANELSYSFLSWAKDHIITVCPFTVDLISSSNLVSNNKTKYSLYGCIS